VTQASDDPDNEPSEANVIHEGLLMGDGVNVKASHRACAVTTTTVLLPVPPLSSTANPLQSEDHSLELVPPTATTCMTRSNPASQAMSAWLAASPIHITSISKVRMKDVTSALSTLSDQVSQLRGTGSMMIRG
jgi:hypothetical protein